MKTLFLPTQMFTNPETDMYCDAASAHWPVERNWNCTVPLGPDIADDAQNTVDAIMDKVRATLEAAKDE